jgi:hypothetical protein
MNESQSQGFDQGCHSWHYRFSGLNSQPMSSPFEENKTYPGRKIINLTSGLKVKIQLKKYNVGQTPNPDHLAH